MNTYNHIYRRRRRRRLPTGGRDDEGGAGGGLEDLLDVLEEDLGEGGHGRRAVVLVLAVHGADDGVRDVHRARDEQVGPPRAVHVVRHLCCCTHTEASKD